MRLTISFFLAAVIFVGCREPKTEVDTPMIIVGETNLPTNCRALNAEANRLAKLLNEEEASQNEQSVENPSAETPAQDGSDDTESAEIPSDAKADLNQIIRAMESRGCSQDLREFIILVYGPPITLPSNE